MGILEGFLRDERPCKEVQIHSMRQSTQTLTRQVLRVSLLQHQVLFPEVGLSQDSNSGYSRRVQTSQLLEALAPRRLLPQAYLFLLQR